MVVAAKTAFEARLDADIEKAKEKYLKSPNTSWDLVRLMVLVKILEALKK